MMEFEKQSEIMDMKEEMMNDAIDDAMGDEDDEEERLVLTQLVVYQVFKYLGYWTPKKSSNFLQLSTQLDTRDIF